MNSWHLIRDQSNQRATLRNRQRLSGASAFERVFRDGLRSADGLFSVLALSNTEGYPRLGLAISRKAAAAAVERNRLKRLIRESFRLTQEHLPAVDIVVMARAGAVAGSNAEIRQSLAAHWERIKRRCEAS